MSSAAIDFSKYESAAPRGGTIDFSKYETGRPATKTEEPGFLDKEIPLSGPWYNPTLSGVQSIGRGVRSAARGAYNAIAHPVDTATATIDAVADLPGQIKEIPGAIRDINASPDPLGTYAKVAQDTAGEGAGQAIIGAITEGTRIGAGKIARPILEKVTPAQAAQAVGGTAGAVKGGGIGSIGGAYVGAKGGRGIAEYLLGKERANSPILAKEPPSYISDTPRPEPLWKTNPSEGTEVPSVLEGHAAPESNRVIYPNRIQATERSTPTPIARPEPAWKTAPSEGTEVPSIFDRQPLANPGRVIARPDATEAAQPLPAGAAGSMVESVEAAPASPATEIAKPAKIGELLERGLGNEAPPKIIPGKPIYQGPRPMPRPAATAEAPAVPKGFTPVESSAIRAYHYDEPTQTFSAQMNNGAIHKWSGVEPEDAEAFRNADSKGKALSVLRNRPGVTGMGADYGNGFIARKPSIRSADPMETIHQNAEDFAEQMRNSKGGEEEEEDLIPKLKASLVAANKAKAARIARPN